MVRNARVEHAGAINHLMNGGDRRESIVRDDADRRLFPATLGQARKKRGEAEVALREIADRMQIAMTERKTVKAAVTSIMSRKAAGETSAATS